MACVQYYYTHYNAKQGRKSFRRKRGYVGAYFWYASLQERHCHRNKCVMIQNMDGSVVTHPLDILVEVCNFCLTGLLADYRTEVHP